MYCVLCRPSLPFLVLPFLDFVSLPAKEKGVPYLEVFWCEFSKKGSALSILSLCFQHSQRHEEPKSPATSTITQHEWVQQHLQGYCTQQFSVRKVRLQRSKAVLNWTSHCCAFLFSTLVHQVSDLSDRLLLLGGVQVAESETCRMHSSPLDGVTKYCTAARGMRYVARSWHSCTTLCTAASAWQPVWRAPYSVWGRAMPQWHVCS